MTRLEDLGVEKDDIDAQLEALRTRKRAIGAEIRALRQGDLHLPPDEIVRIRGHRVYVGGHTPEKWYGIGERQFHYLVSQGLRPEHRFLDIACGSLRLGQYLIPYLDAGNYHGVEGSEPLVKAGLENELLFDLATTKAPKFGYGYGFDFDFVPGFDYAIAQSLFTHLTREDIALCFANLRPKTHADSRFYFTFFEGDEAQNAHAESHANLRWEFSFDTMQTLAGPAWSLNYIGDWGHQADQRMVCATPA